MADTILKVNNLYKRFPVYGSFGRLAPPVSYVNAVSDVSFHLKEGETYGLVGESGSGKTTTGRALLRLTPADSGQIFYDGKDMLTLSNKEFREYRKDIQMIFQDPFSSLNPRKRIGAILEEPLIIHKIGTREERQGMVFEMLKTVGLTPEHYFRYPHEFSGGQRQRLGIARALIMKPKIILCDEPVSALDVSIQAQILNLLNAIQKELKVSLIFITHDIGVVRNISDRIGIMYLGSIVEEAKTDDLFANPRHPYTQALFSAVPDISKSNRASRIILKGEVPAFTSDFKGCPFQTRCPKVQPRCMEEAPAPKDMEPEHVVRCHYA
ncbi:MAG: ATP-binding cassette domain-containing protein [Lacrimispora sp.]